MQYKPMMNASKGAHFADSILCPLLKSKPMRWAFWLNSVVSFSPCKGGFPLSRIFYMCTDVNLVGFRYVNKIKSDIRTACVDVKS